MKNITSFDKKWYEETSFREEKKFGDVILVYEKSVRSSNAVVILENIKTPQYFVYSHSNRSVLLQVFSPEDNDGTEKDRFEKITDVFSKGRRFFDSVYEGQIIELQKAFRTYEDATEKVYKAKNLIGKTKEDKKE